MSSCFAPPAVTLCPSSPVTRFSCCLHFVFTLRSRPSLLFIFALLTRSWSCFSLICNSLAPSFSLATRFLLATFFPAVWARVPAARAVRTCSDRRGECPRRELACVRRTLIVQTRQTILRGTWVNCSEISFDPRLSVPDFLSQLWTKSETESLGSRYNWLLFCTLHVLGNLATLCARTWIVNLSNHLKIVAMK